MDGQKNDHTSFIHLSLISIYSFMKPRLDGMMFTFEMYVSSYGYIVIKEKKTFGLTFLLHDMTICFWNDKFSFI